MVVDNSQFRNMGKYVEGESLEVAQVCYMCAGQQQYGNRNYDVQKRHNGSYTLSSGWRHKQQTSTFQPNKSMAARKSERALHALQQKMERQGNAERLPPATEVAKQLTNNTNMRKAIDWVDKIGPVTYIIYVH